MALLDTPLCDFGWQAPDFELPDPDGKLYKMRDEMGENGLLIAFICNHCPYVKAIADRLSQDAKVLQSEGIHVLAVMSNDYQSYPDDSPDNMKLFAKAHQFSFPYLIDETQNVGKAYGALCTPDFFGLNNKGELQYRGRLDDAMMGSSIDRVPELVNPMRLIARKGEGPREQAPSMGCSIKWRS